MMRVSPYTVAEESLGMSSAARGLQGMERTSAPKGPNLFDGGPGSKVAMNTQPYNNQRLQEQNYQQNMGSAVSQAQAGAVEDSRKQTLVTANSEAKAQQFNEAYKATVLEQMNAPATAALGSQTPQEAKQLRFNVATQKAMAMGVNPDLVANQIESQNFA